MKVTRSQWILITAACVLVASSAAQSNSDRPPGVDETRWVPISDSAGIVLTERIVGVSVRGTDRLELVPTLRPRTGVLMVKTQGSWLQVELELPAARAHPLH